MTVEQLDVIDLISTDLDCLGVTLTISDHLPRDEAHIVLLDKKLEGYRQFVEGAG